MCVCVCVCVRLCVNEKAAQQLFSVPFFPLSRPFAAHSASALLPPSPPLPHPYPLTIVQLRHRAPTSRSQRREERDHAPPLSASSFSRSTCLRPFLRLTPFSSPHPPHLRTLRRAVQKPAASLDRASPLEPGALVWARIANCAPWPSVVLADSAPELQHVPCPAQSTEAEGDNGDADEPLTPSKGTEGPHNKMVRRPRAEGRCNGAPLFFPPSVAALPQP